jgi:LuxR family maltose regulon positive regulatory protein
VPSDDLVTGPDFSDRELQLLGLLRTTMTNREIGNELFISHNTVKSHLRVIYRKLAASSRDEAVAKAAELGL